VTASTERAAVVRRCRGRPRKPPERQRV